MNILISTDKNNNIEVAHDTDKGLYNENNNNTDGFVFCMARYISTGATWQYCREDFALYLGVAIYGRKNSQHINRGWNYIFPINNPLLFLQWHWTVWCLWWYRCNILWFWRICSLWCMFYEWRKMQRMWWKRI